MTDPDHQRDADVVGQYVENKLIYDATQVKLERITNLIETEPDPIAETILFMADTYAVISTQTRVGPHELAFVRVMHAMDMDAIRRVLEETRARGPRDDAVLFHNNKASYIEANLRNVDYSAQLELFRAGKFDELHRRKVDDVAGIGMAKSAFSLAMCGVTQKMCVDGNVARFFGIDPEDREEYPHTVVVDRWESFCADLRERTPTLQEAFDVPNFIWQWVIFDAQRDEGVATHDPWFLTVDEATTDDLLGPGAFTEATPV